MNYSWNIEEIQSKLKNVFNLNDSQSLMKSKIYETMLIDLGYLNPQIKENVPQEEFFLALNQFDLNYFNTPFFRTISYLAEMFDGNDLTFNPMIENDASFNSIIPLCRRFYQKYDKHNLSFFNRILSIDGCIHVLDIHSHSFCGRTYIVDRNEFYILLNGINAMQNFATIIHEEKHVENFLKGYSKGITLYQEMPSYVYEMLAIDYYKQIRDSEDVDQLKAQTLYKYIIMIKTMANQINVIQSLLTNITFYNMIYYNYYENIDKYGLLDIYSILKYGYTDSLISRVVSFIVGTDIYLHTPINNIENVISCYIFGIYRMKPSIISRIMEYINKVLEPYENSINSNKKIKKQY